jgi:hypothetical protein
MAGAGDSTGISLAGKKKRANGIARRQTGSAIAL